MLSSVTTETVAVTPSVCVATQDVTEHSDIKQTAVVTMTTGALRYVEQTAGWKVVSEGMDL